MTAPVQPTPLDRLLTSVRNLIRSEFPAYTYLGVWEYTIQGVNSSTGAIDADPVDTTIPLPVLAGIPLKSPILAEQAVQATRGSLCLIEFINADPTRPNVVSIGATIFEGTIDAAQTVNLGPSAGQVQLGFATSPIARMSDTCVVYFSVTAPFACVGVVTTPPSVPFGSFTGTYIPGTAPGVPSPMPGIIGTGSSKVFA